MCQLIVPSPPKNRVPQLPWEIVWIIVKDLLVDLPISNVTPCSTVDSFTQAIPPNILTLNRYLHTLVVKAAYQTIILTSYQLFSRFRKVVGSSPHLAYLVRNLWIGTPRLGAFLSWGHGGRHVSSIAVAYILSKAPMIKRIALPTLLFPPKFAKLGGAIEHITIGGGSIPELPCKVKTVYIHGSIQPWEAQYSRHGVIRRIVYDLENPCRPGVIGPIIQELLTDQAIKGGLKLEFVILPRLSTWIENELSEFLKDGSLKGALAFVNYIVFAHTLAPQYQARAYAALVRFETPTSIYMSVTGDTTPGLTYQTDPPSNLARSTTLPVELLISIIELSLISQSWSSRATQLGLVLLVNREIYASVAKSAYSTVVLNTIKSVELFFRTVESSPYLAGLIVNLWIATPRLNGFDTSNYPIRVVENKIRAILSKMSDLKRIAVPHEYIPRTGFPRVKHLSTSNDLFPPAIPTLTSLEGLHIAGLPGRNCVNTILSRFIELRSLKIDVFSSESDPDVSAEVSLLCARMVLLFRQRLKNMTSLKISANTSVVKLLNTGLKNTLEEDSRVCLQEQRGGRIPMDVAGNPLLQDTWLVEYGQ